MKLTVHCGYDSGSIAEHQKANELIFQEYALYRIIRAVGLPTFETRLVKAHYLNPDGTQKVEGMGFFIEPDAAFGARCSLDHAKGQIAGAQAAFAKMDSRVLIPYLMARLLVDAADYVVDDGHNSQFFLDAAGETRIIVPYDFNDSSLVASRGFPDGFRPYEAFFAKLRKGPFNKRGEVTQLTAEDQAKWTKSLLAIAKKVMARKDQAFQVFASLPLQPETKENFATHLERFFGQLQGLIAADAKPVL